MDGKRVLVVGGTRQMGPHLVKELLQQGYFVTLAKRGQTQEDFGDCVERIVFDRTQSDEVRKYLGDRHFDVIVDTCAYDAHSMESLLRHVNAEKYVQFSSFMVYENFKKNMVEADFEASKYISIDYEPNHPQGYAFGKRAAEKAALEFNIPNLIIRIPYVGGVDDLSKRLIGFVYNIRNGVQMKVKYENYNRQFAMIHSDEAGRFVLHAMKHNLSGIYNVASTGTVSVRMIVEYIEKTMGKKANILWGFENRLHYCNVPENSMNTDKAKATGFTFLHIEDWLYGVLDVLIRDCNLS